MNTAGTLVLLYCVATAVAIAVRRRRVPYTVALVVVGMALGAFRFVAPPHLTRELLFTFFLPGLLFEAAFHLDLSALRRMWWSAIALAVPGVIVSIGVTAVVLVVGARLVGTSTPVDWQFGLVFGAVVAATDPVAVTAVFRELTAPARLTALVEAESLLNDGTGVVLLSLVLAYVNGSHAGVAALSGTFVMVAGGGVGVGLAVGWVVSKVIQRLEEPMIEIGLTMIAAYGGFVLAEGLGVSGVLATVVAGMVCGRHARELGMSRSSRAAAESYWQYVAFALNSVVFLLIGFEFDASRLLGLVPELIVGFTAMLVARTVIVVALVGAQRRRREPMPWSWAVVLGWGGLRGALSMVLALSLPEDIAHREVLVATAVGAVVISVVVQGLTMPLLVHRLGLSGPSEAAASAG